MMIIKRMVIRKTIKMKTIIVRRIIGVISVKEIKILLKIMIFK